MIRRAEGPVGYTLLGATVTCMVIGFILFRRYEHRIIEHAGRRKWKRRGPSLKHRSGRPPPRHLQRRGRCGRLTLLIVVTRARHCCKAKPC